MTSSLVGSEMCIRDRLRPSRIKSPGHEGDVARFPAELAAALIILARTCLLYTSDAADECRS
eukprot:2651421-Prorocentrum_lima.AAC.1